MGEKPSQYETPKIGTGMGPYDPYVSPAAGRQNADMRKLANIAQTSQTWRPRDLAQSSEKPSSGEQTDVPLLTMIDPGRRAEMGHLIYDLPSPPIINTVRNVERAVFAAVKAKRDTGGSVETKNQANAVLLKFALAHREGHIQGFRRVLEEKDKGTVLVHTILDTAKEKDVDAMELAQRGAALLEAAGDNDDIRARVRLALSENEYTGPQI